MWLYLFLINVITFILFFIDKVKAKMEAWRISERMLILFAASGGSIGALLGMILCRHKIRNPKFKFGVPVIMVIQVILVCCIC